jgi:ribosome-associated protein
LKSNTSYTIEQQSGSYTGAFQDENGRALVEEIVAAMQDRKGQAIRVLDLTELEHKATDYFVLCSGTSDIQTQAIADEVERRVDVNLQDRMVSREGYNSGEWILLDYTNVMVHIFLPRTRAYFKLEELWGDAYTEVRASEEEASE